MVSTRPAVAPLRFAASNSEQTAVTDTFPPPAGAPMQTQAVDAPPTARTVATGRGASWWGEAWRLFAAAPGPWLLIVVVLLVLNVLLALIPVVGQIATPVLYPVFAGGLMLGCRAIDRGQPLTINHLFAGFAERTGPLLTLGVLYFAIFIVITLAVAGILLVIFGAAVLSFGAAVLSSTFQLQDPFSASAAVGGILIAILVGVLLFMLLALPLFMAMWFAPALVALRGLEPWAAMKASFVGCLRNILPFLIYGLVGIGLAVVASIPAMLGWLIVGPMTVASAYAGYCDIFEDASVS
jgi:uncharacterized membrane protein